MKVQVKTENEDSEVSSPETTMKGLSRIGKKTICLFTCGFFIGIILEVLFIERGKLGFFSNQEGLTDEINVTCLILLKGEHEKYVNTSKKTWLRHCGNYYVVKIQKVQKLEGRPIVTEVLEKDSCSGVHEVTAKSAWDGLCKSLHLVKPSQWLMIVPDTLIVLVENLKLFVKNLDCDENHYYGYAIANFEANYNVLSAGILLSRGTVKRLLEIFKTSRDCELSGKYWRNEDLYLGKFLKEINILPKDTRDSEGRGRFHGYNMNNIIWPGKLFLQSDYNKKALYPVQKGYNCCSPFIITMDVSDPDTMTKLYFLLYKIQTRKKEEPLSVNLKKSDGFSWKNFLREEGFSEKDIENISAEEYCKIWEKKLPPDQMYREMKEFLKKHQEHNTIK